MFWDAFTDNTHLEINVAYFRACKPLEVPRNNPNFILKKHCTEHNISQPNYVLNTHVKLISSIITKAVFLHPRLHHFYI